MEFVQIQKEDIKEIRSQVDLPVIGIVKRDYDDSDIYITPTMKEIEELMEVKPEIIAMDATISKRPGGKTLDEFFKEVKSKISGSVIYGRLLYCRRSTACR